MKKTAILILFTLVTLFGFGQQWTGISSDLPTTFQSSLISSTENKITVHLQVPGFYTFEVNTPRGEAKVVSVPKAVSTSEAGEPDLPIIAIAAIIGDQQHYDIKVLHAQYADFHLTVAPSKGNFSRQINPDDVPYTYGDMYEEDAFFPATQVGLYDPYILRDFRGQNMVIHPFAYNPVSQTLRVYYDMTVELFSDGFGGENTLNRRSNAISMDPEFKALYQNHFINYESAAAKYTPMDEVGELLIICHDAFMSAMEPFVNWKIQIGRPTTMVGTSTAGTTSSAIQTYIQNQYDANSNISHVLLVGDVAQIPGVSYTAGSGWNNYSGKSDNMYGQVAGNDFYNEIIVGRFSAENEAQVTTQVNKVIHYERDLNATDTWLSTGTGVATVAGSGGHFGEDDWQHIDNIRNDLLAYTYDEVYRDYPNGGGASSNSATLTSHINAGVSIINYCNHGSETSWGVFSYSNSNVNALINVNKLPLVWSVACLNGKYDHSQPCFGETWLRANNSNDPEQPTGAIGGMFSYISQPWIPPMYGQDEMVDVLTEHYSDNIKHTMGGVSYDGNMKILDQYGQNDNAAKGTYLGWILYGDPTVTLRTDVPTEMNVTHAPTMSTTATSFTVNATNAEGALATLTFNNEILDSDYIVNGTANLYIIATGQTGEATLTVFGYNKVTYVATISITSGGGTNPITMNVSANPTVIAQGESAQLNATATGGNGSFTYSWTPATGLNNPNIANPTASPTTTTNYTCTVTSGDQTQTGTCKVTVVCPPTDLTATVNWQNVQLHWTAPSDASSYKVYRNGTMIAQNITGTSYTDSNLENGTYSYSVATVYSGVTSPNSSAVSATVNATISVNATANPALIALGESSTLTASVTGGSGSTTYSWTPAATLNNPNIMSPVATPTETTTYTVTATRGNLTATDQVTVEVVTPPTDVEATLITDTEDEVEIVWTAATLATTYNLYDNEALIEEGIIGTQTEVADLSSGSHCFTVTAVYNGVESPVSEEACVEIFVCRPPESFQASYYWESSVFGTQLVWMKNEEVNLSLNRFEIYRGLDPEDMELIGTLVNVPFTYRYEYLDEDLSIGEYYYRVVADYGDHGSCGTETMMVNVTDVTETHNVVRVYPNPTNGSVRIDGVDAAQVEVYNSMGQLVKTIHNSNELHLEGLAKGLYQLRITDKNCIVFNDKVLIN